MATTKPIEQWGLSDAKDAAARDLPPDHEVNRKLIEDKDQWQDGTLWPGFRTGDPTTDNFILANVKPQFIADDVLGEATDNRSGAMIGQEAAITLVPLVVAGTGNAPAGDTPVVDDLDEATRQEIEGIIAALSAWWDRVGLWPLMRLAIDRITYAGRSTIRCYVPAPKLVGTGLPTASDLPAALANIELDAPAPSSGARYVDPLTGSVNAVVIEKVDDKEQAQVWTVVPGPPGQPAPGQVVVRILGDAVTTMGPFEMRGRLPLASAKGPRLITPSVRSLQAQLNFISTITTRTVETAGHRERYLGNVDPPGMWLPYPPTTGPALEVDDETDPKQVFYKHRVPWIVGANVTTELVGLPTTTRAPDGTETQNYATPFVQALDPVNPVYATDAAKVVTQRIYRRMKQGHLGLDSTAESSGVAYQQARAQFKGDLDALKPPLEMMLRDLLEAVLAIAGLMHAGSAGILDRYRVAVTLHPSAGPVTPDEARLAVELRDKRAISQSTMLGRLGMEDAVAEQQDIESDPGQNAALWQTLASAVQALLGLDGMTVAGAGFLLHLTEEQVAVLLTGLPPEGSTLAALAATPAPARTSGSNTDAGGNPLGAGNGRSQSTPPGVGQR
jgi:hypothetical protein